MKKVIAISIAGFIGLVALLSFKIFFGVRDDAASYTRHYINFLAMKIDSFHQDNGRLPSSLGELTSPKPPGPYASPREFQDRWQRPYYYRQVPGGCGYILFSLGADGHLGGSGQDKDIESRCPGSGS